MSSEGALRGPLVYAPLEFRLRAGGSRVRDRALITCPKCDAPAYIRDSQRITETVKHIKSHCTNTGCGHTFLMQLSFVHTFSPGLIDRPDLNLPRCPHSQVPHVLPPTREEHDDQISMFVEGAGQ